MIFPNDHKAGDKQLGKQSHADEPRDSFDRNGRCGDQVSCHTHEIAAMILVTVSSIRPGYDFRPVRRFPMHNPRVNPRFSPNNVLFTTDFSSASQTAVPYARAIANWYGSKIFFCHVVPAAGPASGPLSEPNLARQQAEKSMASFVRSAALGNAAYEVVIEQGELWEALAAVIQHRHIDLIVLGTHGRHGIKKLTLGSVAERIFQHAPCPVWTVGPGATQKPFEFGSLKRILFATDFSTSSLHALPYALSLAEENQASIILLHLIPLMPLDQNPAAVMDASRKRLEALLPAEARDWCTPEFVVQSEFPLSGILKVAAEKDVDLIVMGLRHGAASARGAGSIGPHSLGHCLRSRSPGTLSTLDRSWLKP